MLKALFCAAAICIAATNANANNQAPCGPRSDVVRDLASQFNETQAALGLASDGMVMELFVSPDAGLDADRYAA